MKVITLKYVTTYERPDSGTQMLGYQHIKMEMQIIQCNTHYKPCFANACLQQILMMAFYEMQREKERIHESQQDRELERERERNSLFGLFTG